MPAFHQVFKLTVGRLVEAALDLNKSTEKVLSAKRPT